MAFLLLIKEYMKDIFDLRRDFTLQKMDESDVDCDPMVQFEKWFNEALSSEVLEPNAMDLCTVSADSKPSSRIVLLKQIKKEGFVFFSNYNSRKAQEIEANNNVCLTFVWHELEREVRIEGTVAKISAHESDSYFESRPIGSKLGAWASPQSEIIPDRSYLEKLVSDFNLKFEGRNISRPSNWGGYIISPVYFEFWQGRKSRLHDRLIYTKSGSFWDIKRLAP